MSLPFTYLGMLIEGNPRKYQTCYGLYIKLGKVWNLSFAERVCLFKFVITAMPLFYMSFFKISSRVMK